MVPFHNLARKSSAGYISIPFIRRGILSNETMISLTSGNSSEKAFSPLVWCDCTSSDDLISMATSASPIITSTS